jgi:hypothetical protein
MPHLVQMHNDYAKDGLATVSVNLDEPDSPGLKGTAEKMLQSLHAEFTALMLAPGQNVDDWLGKNMPADGLPAQQIYDRHGKLVKTFSGGTEEEINKVVAELLKQK